MLRVTFKKDTGGWGGEKKEYREFLWAYYEKSVFYSSHAKRKKRSLWNTLHQFGTHTKQFHFRAFSKLFWWMLLNKGNLHWKFLQEHKPFHVSQLGFSAFISEAIAASLSVSFCAPSPFCLLPTPHRLPLASAMPIVYSTSKPSQKHLCSNNLSPLILLPTYSTSTVQERCVFQSIHLEKKTHRLKTLRLTLLSDFSAKGAFTGRAPTEQPPGTTAGNQQHHCSGREKE